MTGTESSRGTIGLPERDLTFVLELEDVVLAKRLKPTIEITKNKSISRERQILRMILHFLGYIGITFLKYTKRISKKKLLLPRSF
jgi:hypothetical protein